MVETLDSREKAELLNRAWTKIGADPLRVMLQVNSSGEAQKGGISVLEEEDSEKLCRYSADSVLEVARFIHEKCPMLRFVGLMTIGSVKSDTPNLYDEFELVTKLAKAVETALNDHLPPLELSMGMSGDYEEAVKLSRVAVVYLTFTLVDFARKHKCSHRKFDFRVATINLFLVPFNQNLVITMHSYSNLLYFEAKFIIHLRNV